MVPTGSRRCSSTSISTITSSDAGAIACSSTGPSSMGTPKVSRANRTTQGLISSPVASKPAQRSIATKPPWPAPSSSVVAGGRRYFNSVRSQ